MESPKLLQFRLLYDRTYDERYDSVVRVADRYLPRRWSEATSSFMFRHQARPSALLEVFKSESSIHLDGRDMLIVVDMRTLTYDYIGVDVPSDLVEVLGLPWPLQGVLSERHLGIQPLTPTFGPLAVGLGFRRT